MCNGTAAAYALCNPPVCWIGCHASVEILCSNYYIVLSKDNDRKKKLCFDLVQFFFLFFLLLLFEPESHYIALAVLELTDNNLPLPPECWASGKHHYAWPNYLFIHLFVYLIFGYRVFLHSPSCPET